MSNRLTIRLPNTLSQQVEALATRRGVTVSDIARDALEIYCTAPSTSAAPSPAPPPVPAPNSRPQRPRHPLDCPCILCRQIRRAAQARHEAAQSEG